MYRLLLSLIITASLLFATACPKKKQQEVRRTAAVTVFQLSGLVLDLTKATERASNENLLNNAETQTAINQLRPLNLGVENLKNLIGQMEVNEETPSPSTLAVINKVLSEEVIQPFLTLLTTYSVIAQDKADYLRVIIASIRLSILSISQAMADAGSPVNTGGLANA